MSDAGSRSDAPLASSAAAAPAPGDEAGASAGRGVVFIGAAKIYFMLAGFAIEVGLPRLLGDAVYGAYRFVNQAVSVINNVVVTGTIQAVSRATTADTSRADVAKATGLKMHLFVGVPLAIAFAALAPLVSQLVHDPGKTLPLMVASLIIAGYAFYAVLVGSANGTRQFQKQAGLDMSFATLRAVGLLGAAKGAALLGITAASAWVSVVLAGWVGAVLAIVVLAFVWIGGPRGVKPEAIKPMLTFMGALVAYQVVFNLVMAADTFILKRLATEWYVAAGQPDPSHLADAQVGLYGNAQIVARLPYQLMLAVTFVIFPLISGATFADERDKARAYIRTTMRYSLVFAGLMGTVLAANAGPLLHLFSKTHPGDLALAVLAIGHVAFALFSIGGTVLNSAGRTRDTIVGAVVTLVALIASLWLVLPRLAPGRELLLGAAACTSGAMVLGTLITGGQLWRQFREFVPLLTALRVGAASAAAIVACRFLPEGGLVMAVVGAAVAGVVYLGVLVASFELGKADLGRVLAIAGRKKKG